MTDGLDRGEHAGGVAGGECVDHVERVTSAAPSHFPGTDMSVACDIVGSESAAACTIPLLPERGAHAELVARTAVLLPEVYCEVGARSWVLTDRPQLTTRRAVDTWRWDLDACEQQWGQRDVIVSVMGPWSLATALELPNGHRAVTDAGARRDLNQALEAGVAEAVAGLSARFGGAVQVVLEEPWVPALLQGSVPGTSDFDELAAVPQYEISKALDALAVGPAWLDCASLATLLQWEGPVAFDPLGLKGTAGFDAAAELLSVDKGVRLTLSVDELMGAGDDAARGVAVRVARFVDMLGVGREVLQRIALCAKDGGDALGLAGAIAVAREATDMLHRDAGDL